MDGFFDKYGRVIIIAVAICFVLLYLTPMRNVVGSSINGFAGNFANKVGESIGAVKMPDGSGNIAKEKSSTIIGTVWDGQQGNMPDTQFANAIPEAATTVVFTDEVAPKGASTTDLTVAKDGGVVGWLDGTTWKVSTQDPNKAVTFNESSMGMFGGAEGNNQLTSISFDTIDTSNVINMTGMFYACRNLTSLDLSNFDTSNVTDMSSMFDSCSSLTSLDLSNFNTSRVTNMQQMFNICPSLTKLDISSFNTKHVANMSQMFYNCKNLSTIYVGTEWSTKKLVSSTGSDGYESAVGNMMFYECINLPNYDSSISGENQLQKAHTGTGGYLTLKA